MCVLDTLNGARAAGTYSDRRGAPRHLPSVLQPPSGGGGGARRGGQAQAQVQDELFDRDVRNYFTKSSLPHGLKKAMGGSVAEAARLGTGSSGIR
jgi:hypothetical protein